MLVQPHVGRHDHGADLPLVVARLVALRPHQRIALAGQHHLDVLAGLPGREPQRDRGRVRQVHSIRTRNINAPYPGTALDRKDAWFLGAMGRLKPGVSVEQAQAALASSPIAWGAQDVSAHAGDVTIDVGGLLGTLAGRMAAAVWIAARCPAGPQPIASNPNSGKR